jgi:hypothetical protein
VARVVKERVRRLETENCIVAEDLGGIMGYWNVDGIGDMG